MRSECAARNNDVKHEQPVNIAYTLKTCRYGERYRFSHIVGDTDYTSKDENHDLR